MLTGSDMKISKKRIQEIVEEEVYKVLKELGIKDLSPSSFTKAIRASTTPGTSASPEPGTTPSVGKKEVNTGGKLKNYFRSLAQGKPSKAAAPEISKFHRTVDDLYAAAESPDININQGPVKRELTQLDKAVSDELSSIENQPQEESPEEDYEL